MSHTDHPESWDMSDEDVDEWAIEKDEWEL